MPRARRSGSRSSRSSSKQQHAHVYARPRVQTGGFGSLSEVRTTPVRPPALLLLLLL
jgi:hypothetical protein